jgi:hypothetical protein
MGHGGTKKGCGVGYNEFDFFYKMKNTDPLMGAKLKSKAHLLNTFFDFFEPFFARLTSKFEISTNMTYKIFFEKKSEFHADFESVEKVVKKCTQKKL